MSQNPPAKQYPNSIFKSTTPDETQELKDQPRFQTWYKGYLTRSEIYERKLPDGLTSALRIDGPSDNAISMTNLGQIKIMTGEKTDVAGSGILGIKTYGQQQIHYERSNIQYNEGGEENDGQALNILAYGDVVEQAIGSTRYIKATKIEISASEELVLNGQTIKLQAAGDIEMAASAINSAQVNKKDIVLGQRMNFGAGEATEMQFDPRSTQNLISPGNLNQKVLGDYQLTTGGVTNVKVIGGPGTLVKDRVAGLFLNCLTTTSIQGTTGMVVSGPAGMDLVSAGELAISGTDTQISTANLEMDTANFDVTSAAVSITGTGDVSIEGANVRITGALIYLN